MSRKNKRPRGLLRMNVITSTISTMLVLVLLGIIIFFVTAARNVSNSLRENFTVSLMLDDDIPHADAYRLQTELRRQPFVSHMWYISKEKAAQELALSLGTDPTEFSKGNPLPASFNLQLKSAYANQDSLNRYLPVLRSSKYVLDVSYPAELMRQVNDNIRNVSIVLLVLALLLMIISFELINNTMRMSIHAHRFQIRTMKLVGARWNFIRRPFLRRAFWVGVTAALIADAVLAAGIHALTDFEPQMASALTPEVLLATLGGVLLFGIIIATTCAFFSVNRYLRMSRDGIYLR